MATNYDPSQRPLPGGALQGLIGWQTEELKTTTTSTGKFALNLMARAVDEDCAGRVVYELFTVGTDSDPGADDPKTILPEKAGGKPTMGLKAFNEYWNATGLQATGNFEQDCELATSQKPLFDAKCAAEFNAPMKKVKDPNGDTPNATIEVPNPYADKPPKTRFKKFFKPGEKKHYLEEAKNPFEKAATNGGAGEVEVSHVEETAPPPTAAPRPQ